MSPVPERRSSLRLSIPLRMEIGKVAGEPGSSFKIEVVVSNISTGGAYFETDRCHLFDIGKNVEVIIHLPQSGACEALSFPRLRTSATVLRTQNSAVCPAGGGPLEPRGIALKFNDPLLFI